MQQKPSGNRSAILSTAGENDMGKLEALKQREAELAEQLAAIRREKLDTLRSRPLSIGVIGFGRFGQFIAKTFTKYGRVVVTSRSDYTDIAASLGAKYVPLSEPDLFLEEDLDVIVVAVSIVSFQATIDTLSQHIERRLRSFKPPLSRGPLIVDVLSVKEHARKVMLKSLPPECDILCSHPMFGPDSGKNGYVVHLSTLTALLYRSYSLLFQLEKSQFCLRKDSYQQSSFGRSHVASGEQ